MRWLMVGPFLVVVELLAAMAVARRRHSFGGACLCGRREPEQEPPDLAAVRQGFLDGGNHPDEVEGMVQLFCAFGT